MKDVIPDPVAFPAVRPVHMANWAQGNPRSQTGFRTGLHDTKPCRVVTPISRFQSHFDGAEANCSLSPAQIETAAAQTLSCCRGTGPEGLGVVGHLGDESICRACKATRGALEAKGAAAASRRTAAAAAAAAAAG